MNGFGDLPGPGPIVPTGLQTINAELWNGYASFEKQMNQDTLAPVPQTDRQKSLPSGVIAMTMADNVYGEPNVFTSVALVPLTKRDDNDPASVIREFKQKTDMLGFVRLPAVFEEGQPVQGGTAVVVSGILDVRNTHPTEALRKNTKLMTRPPMNLVNKFCGIPTNDMANEANPWNALETFSFDPLNMSRDELSNIFDFDEVMQIDAVRDQFLFASTVISSYGDRLMKKKGKAKSMSEKEVKTLLSDARKTSQKLSEAYRQFYMDKKKVDPGIARVATDLAPMSACVVAQLEREVVADILTEIEPAQRGAVRLDTKRPGDIVKEFMNFLMIPRAEDDSRSTKKRPIESGDGDGRDDGMEDAGDAGDDFMGKKSDKGGAASAKRMKTTTSDDEEDAAGKDEEEEEDREADAASEEEEDQEEDQEEAEE